MCGSYIFPPPSWKMEEFTFFRISLTLHITEALESLHSVVLLRLWVIALYTANNSSSWKAILEL